MRGALGAGCGWRVWGVGFRFGGGGCGVWGVGFRFWGAGCRFLEIGVEVLRWRVCGLGCRMEGQPARVPRLVREELLVWG